MYTAGAASGKAIDDTGKSPSVKALKTWSRPSISDYGCESRILTPISGATIEVYPANYKHC